MRACLIQFLFGNAPHKRNLSAYLAYTRTCRWSMDNNSALSSSQASLEPCHWPQWMRSLDGMAVPGAKAENRQSTPSPTAVRRDHTLWIALRIRKLLWMNYMALLMLLEEWRSKQDRVQFQRRNETEDNPGTIWLNDYWNAPCILLNF